MGIIHNFRSPLSDDGLPLGAVKPSNWNEDHIVTGLLGALNLLDTQANVIPYLDINSVGQLAPVTALGLLLLGGNDLYAIRTALGLSIGGAVAAIDSPNFIGLPTAPTAVLGANTNQIATMAAVQAAITALIGGAPGALDTLNELATAINDDASFAATVTTALGVRLRVDAAQGLSSGQKAFAVANLGLAALAVSGAWADITGKPAFATVATSAAYADLTGKPTLGTAAPLNVGTGANNVVQLDGSGKMPAVDASALINLPSGESVGSISYFPGTAAPAGKIKANGVLLSRTTYAGLWAYAQASGNIVADGAWQRGKFSTGDLSTTFRIPDHRGLFNRGFDDGAGVDSGRVIGTYQADLFASHAHPPNGVISSFTGNVAGGPYQQSQVGGGGYETQLTGNAGGAETRPQNIALLACIKY